MSCIYYVKFVLSVYNTPKLPAGPGESLDKEPCRVIGDVHVTRHLVFSATCSSHAIHLPPVFLLPVLAFF